MCPKSRWFRPSDRREKKTRRQKKVVPSSPSADLFFILHFHYLLLLLLDFPPARPLFVPEIHGSERKRGEGGTGPVASIVVAPNPGHFILLVPSHFFLRTLCAEILPSSGTEREKEKKVFLSLPFPRRRRSIKTSCPFYILILFPSPSSCGLYPPTGIEFKRRERRKGKREGGREDFPIERTPGATPLKVVPLSPFFPSLVYTSYPSPFLPPSPPSPLRADFFDIKETIGRIPIGAKKGRGKRKRRNP